MKWGVNIQYSDRGVSNVVGVVLLIGITLAAVGIILAAGYVTINDANQDANKEVAEETMLQIDSTLQQSDGENTSVGIPDDIEGKVGVSNDAQYRLTLDGNGDCTTGSRDLSSVEYGEGDSSVAYEGGGVWEETESGATMVSPPDITYVNGSLTVAFTEINGQITSSNEFQPSRNASEERIHQYNMSRALYTDGTYEDPPADGDLDYVCQPSQVQTAELTIENSQYARAWADWARNNYDGYVEVKPAAGSVDPGDTVTITFPLGDVSDPYYEVTDLEVNRDSASDQPEVTATVTNTGGLEPDSGMDVDLRYGGTDVETESVQLAEGEDTTVSATLSDSDITPLGDKNVEVASPNETATESLEFTDIDGYPQIELDNTVDSTAGVGSDPPNSYVTVENTGDMTAYETITMYVDGTAVWTDDVVVAPGETEDVEVDEALPTNDVGTYNVTFRGDIESGDKQEINPFEVGNQGYLDATITDSPTDIDEGDVTTIEADIDNTGEQSVPDRDVTVEVVDTATGTTVADKTVEVDLDGSASASGPESTTVSLDYTADDGVGNYEYIVDTGDDTESGAFMVGDSPSPNFLVTQASISENPVVQGPDNTTTFTVEVKNTGTEAGTQPVRLQNVSTGTVLEEQTETLAAGDSTTIQWTVDSTDFDIGNNRVNVSTENTSVERNLQVLESEPTVTDSGTTITITERADVRVAMAGAELESTWDGDEFTSPTEMTLVIENSSGRYERVLWEDVSESGADVNHAAAEQEMYQNPETDPYIEELSVEPDTELSLFATSYYCTEGNYVDTGIDHIREDASGTEGTLNGLSCDYERYQSESDTGTKRLRINSDSNSQNVVINSSGEEVPAFDQADPLQLSLEQMLGNSRIEDGTLQLADDERVFLYELSREDAEPSAAEDIGDPDYNDAVALFQVTSVDKTVTEPPEFVITDQDAPSSVTVGDDAEVKLTVGNNGGEAGSTTVEFDFAGNPTETVTTGELAPGETETLSFDLDTSSAGTYEWEGNATATDGAERSGFVTIGNPPESNFVVTSFSGDNINDTDGSPEADVTVENTGGASDTQDIVLEVRDDDGGGGFSDEASRTADLDPGDSESVVFDLPSDQGNYTYRVSTDDTETSERDLFVGRSEVIVNPDTGINIGTQEEGTDEIIEREGSISATNVNLQNVGNVGDERDVNLTIRDQDSGDKVFEDTDDSVGVPGSGVDLTGPSSGPASGQAQFDFNSGEETPSGGSIEPGYYEYTIRVYNDTEASGEVETEVTGEIFLKEVSTETTNDDSPISVDAGTVTVGE